MAKSTEYHVMVIDGAARDALMAGRTLLLVSFGRIRGVARPVRPIYVGRPLQNEAVVQAWIAAKEAEDG